MKNLLFVLAFLLVFVWNFFLVHAEWETTTAWNCTYEWSGPVWEALRWCVPWSTDVANLWDLEVLNLKYIAQSLVRVIGSILWVIAVGSLVYASYLLVISRGEEEKVSQAKKIIQWTLVWFIALITAGALITIVINIVYSLGSAVW